MKNNKSGLELKHMKLFNCKFNQQLANKSCQMKAVFFVALVMCWSAVQTALFVLAMQVLGKQHAIESCKVPPLVCICACDSDMCIMCFSPQDLVKKSAPSWDYCSSGFKCWSILPVAGMSTPPMASGWKSFRPNHFKSRMHIEGRRAKHRLMVIGVNCKRIYCKIDISI